MKKLLASLAAAAFLAGAINAMADDGSKAADPKAAVRNTFQKMDRNGDGKVSADEYKSYWIDVFGIIDTDKDGKISEAEHKTRSEKFIAELDKDGDAVLTKEEYVTFSKPAGKIPEKGPGGALGFVQADINADGSMTVEEYYLVMSDSFDKYDKNKDGKLDKDEMAAMFLEVFRTANIDKDGVVTKDEWVAYWVGVLPKAEPVKEK